MADTPPKNQPSLRLSMVTETYPPEVNDVATTVSRVVHGLRQRGHDLQVVRPRQQTDEPVAATSRQTC